MTKVYVMESCPDCTQVKQLYKDNPEYAEGAACNLDGTGC